MAVRHGYGKIAGTDALVFAYDTGDTRNSYRGEPTVNYITTMAANLGGNVSLSYPNNVYICTAQETNVVDPTAPGGQYSRFTGNTDSDNNQLFTSFVDGSVNARNTTVAYSVYLKGTGTCHLTVYSDIAGYSITPTITLTSEWTRYSIVQAVGNYTTHAWAAVRGILTSTNVYVAAQQVEFNSHVTPFVNGTRSATQGLLDLTGNSSIDLSNVSFDSNAQPTWDGTNDQIAITGFTQPTDPNIYSVEAVVKLYAHNPGTNIGSVIVNNYSSLYGWIFYLNGPLSYLGIRHHDGASGGYDLVYGTGINLNQFYHIVATDDKTTVRLYLNGTQVASRASATALNYSGQPTIGQFGGNNAVTNGEIPVVKIYNKTLSADEVRNNYRHYKTRFDI